jgi:hypothetical protein
MISKLTELTVSKILLGYPTMGNDALKWLRQKVSQLKNVRSIPGSISRETIRHTNEFYRGGLYFFFYNPKTKDELPYYDTFPLVLVLEKYPDGFLGLNLHYLPTKYRVAFLQKLIAYGGLRDSENEVSRVRITYDILKTTSQFKEFGPCLKRYLLTQVRSRILAIEPEEWDVAISLPVQQFKKASAKDVWKESIEEIKAETQNGTIN